MVLFQEFESNFLRLKYVLIQLIQTQDPDTERKIVEHLKGAEEAVRNAHAPSYHSIHFDFTSSNLC